VAISYLIMAAHSILASLDFPALRAPRLGSQPNIIPTAFQPSVQLEITFANGQQAVHLGNVVRAGSCKEAPSVRISLLEAQQGGGEGSTFTLMLIDPDAPTPEEQKFGYWRHWIVTGLRAGGEREGKVLTRYLGPGPKDE
jgi:phosphatidylethanolamine-binding protein